VYPLSEAVGLNEAQSVDLTFRRKAPARRSQRRAQQFELDEHGLIKCRWKRELATWYTCYNRHDCVGEERVSALGEGVTSAQLISGGQTSTR
jgi:hypothetical protein